MTEIKELFAEELTLGVNVLFTPKKESKCM